MILALTPALALLMASRMPESDELPALISGSLPPPCWMVSTLSLVAMAALLSF